MWFVHFDNWSWIKPRNEIEISELEFVASLQPNHEHHQHFASLEPLLRVIRADSPSLLVISQFYRIQQNSQIRISFESRSNVWLSWSKVSSRQSPFVAILILLDLEWKLIYVGSAESESFDQELDTCMVGPVPVGVNSFEFEVSNFLVDSYRTNRLTRLLHHFLRVSPLLISLESPSFSSRAPTIIKNSFELDITSIQSTQTQSSRLPTTHRWSQNQLSRLLIQRSTSIRWFGLCWAKNLEWLGSTSNGEFDTSLGSLTNKVIQGGIARASAESSPSRERKC